jgi:hypothetical protein
MALRIRHMLALCGLVAGALLPTPASAAPAVHLIAWQLDSPRSVAFVGERAVVSESGHGSDDPADCFPTGFGNTCVGNTSRITWINTTNGNHTTLASGFFSIALDPVETLGVSGLSYRDGKLYAQISATSREVPPSFAIGQEAGDLISVNPSSGHWKTVAQVGDNDFDFTLSFTQPDPATCGQCPGTQEHDANPTGVLASDEGIFVADSGANTLTRVGEKGHTSVIAYFPWRDPNFQNFPSDDVPTCVASRGDSLYVGTLAGHLYRVDEEGHTTQLVPRDAAGNLLLSHVTGCTSDGRGNLYITNMFGPGQFSDPTFANGSVVKFNPSRGTGSVVADAFHNPALFFPYGDIIGPDGDLYVVTGAVCNVAGDNPFAGAPFNPCVVGDKAGGRLVKIDIAHDD